MRIVIESTDKITDVGGVQCRVWEGATEGGVLCFVFVHRIAVHIDENRAEFDRELKAQLPPTSTTRFVDLRKVLG